jgi:hypothetical protein
MNGEGERRLQTEGQLAFRIDDGRLAVGQHYADGGGHDAARRANARSRTAADGPANRGARGHGGDYCGGLTAPVDRWSVELDQTALDAHLAPVGQRELIQIQRQPRFLVPMARLLRFGDGATDDLATLGDHAPVGDHGLR